MIYVTGFTLEELLVLSNTLKEAVDTHEHSSDIQALKSLDTRIETFITDIFKEADIK